MEEEMIPPCTVVTNAYALGPVAFVSHYSCDIWAVPHFVAPFMVTLWTRWWFFGAFIAAFGEQIEAVLLWAFQSFVVFVGGTGEGDFNVDAENLAGSQIDDIVWMGYLGVFFGWVFYSHFAYPALLRYRDIWRGRGALRVLFYGVMLFGVNIALTASLYGLRVNGFRLGILLYPIIHGLSFLVTIRLQPRAVWAKYTRWEAAQFWGGMWLVSALYNAQNLFDWFYSSHLQATLVTAILLVAVMLPWSVARWRWPQRLRASFDFAW